MQHGAGQCRGQEEGDRTEARRTESARGEPPSNKPDRTAARHSREGRNGEPQRGTPSPRGPRREGTAPRGPKAPNVYSSRAGRGSPARSNTFAPLQTQNLRTNSSNFFSHFCSNFCKNPYFSTIFIEFCTDFDDFFFRNFAEHSRKC